MAAEWYYADQGQQQGPVTFDELQQRAASGQLRPTDLVWKSGMNDWVPASSQPGLFGGMAPRAAAPRQDYDDRSSQDDLREYDRPRRSSGSGGLKIALFVGGALVLFGILCCGVLGVIIVANSGPGNERTWNLNVGQVTHWAIPFQQGDRVTLNVFSTNNSDMDLFVFTDKAKMDQFLKMPNFDVPAAVNLCLNFDNGTSKDCHVEFTAPATQDYWVLLVNRNSKDQPARNGKNSGKLVFQPLPK